MEKMVVNNKEVLSVAATKMYVVEILGSVPGLLVTSPKGYEYYMILDSFIKIQKRQFTKRCVFTEALEKLFRGKD